MLLACWSPKGGSGTTVVATGLALLLARSSPQGALLADLAGDIPAVLGLPQPEGPGLADWLAAGPQVPHDALARLEVSAGPGLGLLPGGIEDELAQAPADRAAALTAALAADPRPVIADCGRLGPGSGGGPALAVASGATVSLLVLRPCYLALRRALQAPIRPTGVIVVHDGARALRAADVGEVLGVPVRAELPCDPAIARAVDAGLLARRIPRPLARALRGAA